MNIKSIFKATFWRAETKHSAPKKRRRIYSSIKKQRVYRVDLEMDKLGDAIDAARDPERPIFDDLYSIYEQIKKDRRLKSQVDMAINDIQQEPFVVNVDGAENEELRELFDAEWFDDFVNYAADAENWGNSLIEFPEVNEIKRWNACYLLPRENVNPATGEIILDRISNIRMPYRDNIAALNLVEIEGKEDLGMYEYAAEEVILKKYARTDWSQASERYGMPWLDYATDVEDKAELDKIEDMAANFAAKGYIIRGKDDAVEIKQPQSGDYYKIYQEAIDFSNQEITILMNGQSGTTDNQAYVGTAEVHERVKNVFKHARIRRIQNHINGKLIPLMILNGYDKADLLSRAKVKYPVLDDSSSVTIPEQESEPDPSETGDGKQTKAALAKSGGKKKVLPAPW